jgi:hypothetical protein
MSHVTISGDEFFVDGAPTYARRTFEGQRVQGLLMNNRTVQATFDDENPATRHLWAYPDTGAWDPDRNVREYIEALPVYREHGLLAVTLNLQGGNPKGYQREQPWVNTALRPDGSLKPIYLDRLAEVIEALDRLGMVAILGIYYFAQDEVLVDEEAVRRGVDNTVRWVLGRGYRNVIVEVNNECDVARYEHEVLQPHRVHELIAQVRDTEVDGRRLLVGTSYKGGSVPGEEVVAASDFLLIHGNGVSEPERIAEMVERTRALGTYRPMPILFNEDDHFDFERPQNNMRAAVSRYASWGLLDIGEGTYRDGFQSPPVQWQPLTERKQGYLRLLKEITGGL